jgi:N-acetylmuramoyl-L-alanine amidase CwlA
MNIRQDLIAKSKYSLKCPYSLTPKYIVIHNTSNDASAEAEVKYMKNNNNPTSFHYAVDDVCAVQGIPENRNAFHAGDGENGKGNRYGIAIEICFSKSGGYRFHNAEDNAAKLTALLLKKYGLDISAVKKHQDFSGKYCPHRTLDMGWDRFIERVRMYMEAFKDTQGHWAEKHIEKLKKAGIVNGHADGTFRPDEPITRAEVAVMVANILTYLGK